jgi:hypothetical protein
MPIDIFPLERPEIEGSSSWIDTKGEDDDVLKRQA